MASNSPVSNLKRGRGRPIGSKDKVPRASRKLKAAAAPPGVQVLHGEEYEIVSVGIVGFFGSMG
jgi:hypothetical protein